MFLLFPPSSFGSITFIEDLISRVNLPTSAINVTTTRLASIVNKTNEYELAALADDDQKNYQVWREKKTKANFPFLC